MQSNFLPKDDEQLDKMRRYYSGEVVTAAAASPSAPLFTILLDAVLISAAVSATSRLSEL